MPLDETSVAGQLTAEEVDKCNEITQIYTRDYIYYRDHSPKILPSFTKCDFLELEDHMHPWLDNLLDEACRFREQKPS